MGGEVLHDSFGFFPNGDLQDGITNFTNSDATYVSQGGPHASRDFGYINIDGGNGGSYIGQGLFYPDLNEDKTALNKDYQQITYVKTLTLDSDGNKSGGHIGMAPYDIDNNRIDQRSLGGRADTFLSRELNAGDSYAYVSGNAGWSTASQSYFRHLTIYPPSHPKYSRPHEYSRIGYPDPSIYYSTAGPEVTAEGDYRLTIVNSSDSATTFPNIGYSTPVGTPVTNGRAGATYPYYNYLHTYPTDWTRISSQLITGLGNWGIDGYRSMPWGICYMRTLVLKNYTYRTGPNDGSFGMANFFVGPVVGGKTYSNIV
tara:strand:+ start:683 stop:1624 length:942 start_codon:yes stop_codon:yes gene_type:complete